MALDDRAAHRGVLNDQFMHRRRQPHRYLQVERRFGEAACERVAVGQRHAAAMAQHVDGMLRQAFCDIDRRGQRLGRAHEMDDVLARAQHHAEHGEFGQGTAEGLDVLAQFAAVERPRHHRTAALRAARGFRVIIRKGQRHVEAHRCLRRKEIDGLGTCGKKRVDTSGIKAVAGLVPQIGTRLFRAFDDAPGLRQRGTGNPQPAARARGGAAEARLLLDNEDVEAMMPRGDRCRHPGTAGAHHQHVAFEGFLFVARHAFRPASLFPGGHLDWDGSACQSCYRASAVPGDHRLNHEFSVRNPSGLFHRSLR